MEAGDFFSEIAHVEVPWGERSIWVPLFYRDMAVLRVAYLASAAKLREWLPSGRMHPLRITPGQGVLSISAYCYRDCDIGPYNEVSISVPFTLDKPSPLFTGFLGRGPSELDGYIHHLPVTTQVARDAGVEFAGYPKFVAEIDFEVGKEWVICRLAQGGRDVLTMSGRVGELRDGRRSRQNAYTARSGRLLRSQAMASACQVTGSKNPADLRLELGEHPIADELRQVGIGRMLGYGYVPSMQLILTPVIESLAL
jgi:hypothetical protein